MLKIYEVILVVIERLRPVVAKIAQHDASLAKQMRDAATSVALNTAEGSGQRGGHRRERYRTALGSARETQAGLDTAVAWGYIDAQPELRDMLEHVAATLIRNV
jgi:four helix bundle protein